MNLFFGQKAKVTPKDSIVELRNTLQMLEKRETFLQTKIDNELKIAKANATKNRRAALMALKRKKQYEGQIEKISGSRLTIETQVMAIENANVNLETMKALRAGAAAMKGIHGAMDINQVDQTMEEIRDQMEIAEEISNVISQPVAFGVEMDEDELAAELDELEQEELDKKLMETERPSQIGLPSVPNHEPEEEDEEEADLRELRETRPRTLSNKSKRVMAGGSSHSKSTKKRGEPSDTLDASPSAKKPMFSIFEKKPSKPLEPADIRWETHGTSFIVGEAFNPKAGSKVAAFDLDQTLIKVNGKHKWPKNADDWVWWAASVPAHLKEIADTGYTIVIITNQGGLDGNVARQDEMRSKFEKISAQLRLPMWILISMQKDHYRKPMTGLWHWLEAKFHESNIEIDRADSYYVGDAAGRHDGWKVGAVKDFNNTDRCIKAVEESLKNKRAVVIDNTNPDVATRASYIALAKKHNVPARCFLFMANKDLAAHNNYFRAFHRPLIEVANKASFKEALSTTATMPNSTATKSKTTLKPTSTTTEKHVANEGSSSTSVSISQTALTATKVRDEPPRERLSEMVFASYAKKYQEPTLKEGFSEIKKINFVPDEDIRSTWERWYL
ncbi:Charged multivesicular body protein 4b [Mortierella sp. AD011]|nr:Charged multivesicular body protein 4b [Mortierella sp. AD010]KAF9398934.1 Charged multivesicular body protein 4b [Mortierella sp. AD011]